MAVAVTDRFSGTHIASLAEELADLVLQRLLQNQPGTEAPDLSIGSSSPPTPCSTSSSSRRNLSLGTTFSMRANLHLGLVQGPKQRLCPSNQIPRPMGRDHKKTPSESQKLAKLSTL
jgi:hypothetical protein